MYYTRCVRCKSDHFFSDLSNDAYKTNKKKCNRRRCWIKEEVEGWRAVHLYENKGITNTKSQIHETQRCDEHIQLNCSSAHTYRILILISFPFLPFFSGVNILNSTHSTAMETTSFCQRYLRSDFMVSSQFLYCIFDIRFVEHATGSSNFVDSFFYSYRIEKKKQSCVHDFYDIRFRRTKKV